MGPATGKDKRIVAVVAVLAMAAASAACGGDTGDPPAAAPAQSPAQSGHGHAAPPSQAPLRAGERFVTLTMPQPYTPVAPDGGTDEYRCFLVDPKLTTEASLTGSQFLPQNADIVHHAIFFRIAPADVAEARTLDENTPGEGWQCFGDSGVTDDSWVAHWAPGANEVLLGEHLGYEMPPGSQLVMQVHYNLLATGGKSGATDRSSIRLRLADTAATTPLETFQLAAPIELPCTKQESGPLCDRATAVKDVGRRFGAEVGGTEDALVQQCGSGRAVAGNTQHCDYPLPSAATVYAAAGHMHLLGRSIKIELNPGSAGARTLLDVPHYNFDDQALRPLAAPVRLKQGDVLRVTCTHDAGLRKQLPQLRQLPPRYVVWGDGTADEMCLGLLIGTPAS
ncbi:monooxygenase [Actinoplanes sp. NPDC049668]|uniref:monooxygenase n=1 Tax=unclassified Actinoplanes TaxID=2626549 RepID=UPI0033A15126